MERLLTLVAGLVAACVVLLLPAMAALAGYRSLASIVDTEAEINARLATQLVNLNPELWQVQTARLQELLRQRPADATPEARAVLDLQGRIVDEVSDAPDPPLLERRRPVHDAGAVVGTLRVQRSLRPLLLTTAAFGLLGLALGGGIFAVLRLLPLRALRRTQARLLHEATHDGLTGLPNRLLFLSRLQEAMDRAHAIRRPLALLVLDLDRFKDINDSLGHAAGDEVLRHMAAVLTECLATGAGPTRRRFDKSFTVSRLGGDEFTAIVDSAGTVDDTSALAARILHRLAQPLHVAGRELVVTASIGIAMYPQDNTDLETLLRQADMAMYRAKDLGRNTWHFFNDELNRAIQRRIAMEQDLRGALERGEFELHYQPKADLAGGRITGVEALLRWRRPGEGLIPPDRFIGALEESGLIVPVGDWVLATACAQLVAWDHAGLPPLAMAVNLSARQFRELDLPERIERILQGHGLSPQRLELELTESLLMEDSEQSRAMLLNLDRIGVRLAIDDFGTGYSSLAYLKRFRVDTLKIDRSFVRDLPHDADNGAITSAVAALAHSLGLTVVCEGVETAEQLAFLRSLGCDEVQGFLLARPMPAETLADWLRRHEAGDAVLTAWHRAAEAAPRLTLLRGALGGDDATAAAVSAGSAPPAKR